MLHPLAPPLTPGHLLGTDQYGRDILARIIYGGRIDLAIAFGATSVTLVSGTIIGLVAGYFGGRVDNVLMRIVDLFFAFPFLVLIIAIIAMLGPSIFNMFVAIWITSWVATRGSCGRRPWWPRSSSTCWPPGPSATAALRVMFRHILPNVASAVIIFSMVDAIGNIILAASLGFLGLGAQPPTPEWGTMIADGQNYIFSSWWLATMPGLAIVFVGVAFSLIGDGLAELLQARWPMSGAGDPLLSVRDLRSYLATGHGVVRAVDGVSFTVHEAEILGIVGESGCGKTVTCRTIMGLMPAGPPTAAAR